MLEPLIRISCTDQWLELKSSWMQRNIYHKDLILINSARKVVEGLFEVESTFKFSDEVIGHFVSEYLPVPSNNTDVTGKLYHMLKSPNLELCFPNWLKFIYH